MTALQKHLAKIHRLVDPYQQHWGGCRHTEIIKSALDKEQNLWDRKNFDGHLTAVAIVLNPDQSKVLLLRHHFTKMILAPGGHCDSFEHPEEAARRELQEETGLADFHPHPWHKAHGIPLDIDVHTVPDRPSKQEPAHPHFDFRYLYITKNPGLLYADTTEVDDVAFWHLEKLKENYNRVYEKLISIRGQER